MLRTLTSNPNTAADSLFTWGTTGRYIKILSKRNWSGLFSKWFVSMWLTETEVKQKSYSKPKGGRIKSNAVTTFWPPHFAQHQVVKASAPKRTQVASQKMHIWPHALLTSPKTKRHTNWSQQLQVGNSSEVTLNRSRTRPNITATNSVETPNNSHPLRRFSWR